MKLDDSKETAAPDLTQILQRGLSYHQRGDLKQAENNYRIILDAMPNNADALHLLGVLSNQKQDHTSAIELIGRAIQILPNHPIFLTNLGNALRDDGRYKQAICSYQKALQIKPDLAEVYINMGIACDQLADFKGAMSAYQKAIRLKPDSAEAYYNLGNTYKEQQRFDEAIECYQRAVAINPAFAEALYNLANVFEQQGHLDLAIDCLKQCLRIDPQCAEAHNNMGNLLNRSGNSEQAFSHYQKAVALQPGLNAAQNNLGNAFRDLGRWTEAIVCYQAALQFHPQCAEAHLNLGIALAESDRPETALDHFQAASRVNPEFAEACHYMGIVLAGVGRRSKAIDYFKKAIDIDPGYADPYSYLIYQLQYVCDWSGLETVSQRFEGLSHHNADGSKLYVEPPFIRMARGCDLVQQLENARSWCRKVTQPLQNVGLPFEFESRRRKAAKLKIGYLSADFHDHATAHLMMSVFGLHDRQHFEIYCYSYGPDDHSAYRKHIRAQSDQFVDLREQSHIDAARHIYADQIDILVDLKGHTQGARLGILACRPAPVQVHYLGYPGTTGADFIDYLVTDRIVTPPWHASFYSEKFAILPNCYQVNDYQQEISPRTWSRQEQGLPENGIVFSSFNLPYKIDPAIFDCWMRILKKVPSSVLWLFQGSETAVKNLRLEARGRGVDPGRLVFADKLSKADHLARLQLADLALDTRLVNGHTTTSDSLWAGVPVLTLMGEQFAARVSASLLTAIGLPELIADHLEAYERLAVRLATHPAELQRTKIQLSYNRLTKPLFNTAEFVCHLESAYLKMWSIFEEGKAPQSFEVSAD